MRTVTVQLKSEADFKTIDALLQRHNLHPLQERLEPPRLKQPRRVTFSFATTEEAAFAFAVLAEFLI
jgi:hypothetical protein